MSDKIVSSEYFHFSLAPVQGFIAQARRTRDFWAGSFILSWLSAVAMRAVVAQNGTVIFPKPDDDFLLWLEAKGKKPAPEHGSVPNRFKASVKKGFEPQVVVDTVNTAWKALAEKVYEGDLTNINAETKLIWDRQVEAYWELNWVISNGTEDSSSLDERKNWCSYSPPDETGVKCMIMDGWQELSGSPKPNDNQLTEFWQAVRDNGKHGIKTDLRKSEHLCAIAFIKRRFVRYFEQLDQPMVGWTLTLKGWKVDAGRPSVAYMAAVHWLEDVLIQARSYPYIKQQLLRFHDEAIKLTEGNYNEWGNQIKCIKNCGTPDKWKALDGNVFFESALENINIYDNQVQAKLVLKELKILQTLVSQEKPNLHSATPFYAVLMMDGDSLGKQMSDTNKQKAITTGLDCFTTSMPDWVKNHNGFLIYAGGDDVLAILPLEDALSCALAIRERYEAIFSELNKSVLETSKVNTSISAAVVFAHIKMPLTKVLKNAHELLDVVAKEKYGRDSLAVRVWKPGGLSLEWARPWECAIDNKQLVLERLAKNFADDDNKDGQLSNRFLYKIRERLELLNPPAKPTPTAVEVFTRNQEKQAVELMAAEYFSSGLYDPYPGVDKMEHARAVIRPLLQQCRPIYRDEQKPNSPEDWQRDDKVLVDGALLVRFLAQKGVNV